MHPDQRWTVRRSRRRVAGYWEIRSTCDIVGICYGTREEAECMASAPQQHLTAEELRTCTKQLVAILGLFEERLVSSERAALDRARALTAR
jgi:hypothetical protein